MSIDKYFESVAEEMQRQSTRVRASFSTHRPSAGENRESIVAQFLQYHLPNAFGVSTGLILTSDELFSNQADVLITDVHTNFSLYSTMPGQLWLIESVYAMVEVKTVVSPSTLSDAISKCRRFKLLTRNFSPLPALPRIADSLFIIWAFDSPATATVKDIFATSIADVPRDEQPDFLIVPNKLIAKSGAYHELAKLGQSGSSHRQQIEANESADELLGEGYEVWDLGGNSLMTFVVWLNSWLSAVGTRTAPIMSYVPPGNWGRVV